jgi:hypothetical protein
MNLTGYLSARGARMLMPCEARAFGVPHPLGRHWAEKYGDLELTMVQLENVFVALKGDRRPSAENARRGLLAAAQDCVSRGK